MKKTFIKTIIRNCRRNTWRNRHFNRAFVQLRNGYFRCVYTRQPTSVYRIFRQVLHGRRRTVYPVDAFTGIREREGITLS